MRLLSPCLALLLLSAATSLWAAEPVRSVPALDMGRYAGQWHEIAHLPVSFQKKCVGDITATYALRGDGRISVHNACRTADGERIAAEGVARPVEGAPGQLQVRFVPDWLAWVPLVWADYWVIALDPDYQWALVGDPRASTCGSCRARRAWTPRSSTASRPRPKPWATTWPR
jgi:apolipoprotein D and lipocalin family protein